MPQRQLAQSHCDHQWTHKVIIDHLQSFFGAMSPLQRRNGSQRSQGYVRDDPGSFQNVRPRAPDKYEDDEAIRKGSGLNNLVPSIPYVNLL